MGLVLSKNNVKTITVNGAPSFAYTQATPLSTWIVLHNLGFRPAGVTVFDQDGVQVEGSVQHANTNQLSLSFSQPISGLVLIS
jgi:hypothetical protein